MGIIRVMLTGVSWEHEQLGLKIALFIYITSSN